MTTLTPRGHVESERRLSRADEPESPSFVANAHGQAVIGWTGRCRSCISTVAASTKGAISTTQTLAVPDEVPEGDVTMAVDALGTSSAVWMEQTPTHGGYVVNARAFAPGAQTFPIALLGS